MRAADLKIGIQVVIIDKPLNVGALDDVPTAETNPFTPYGQSAIVVAINEDKKNSGKWIALCLKEEWERAHTCDGLVPVKHGWYSRPEYLYTEEAHQAHVNSTEAYKKQVIAAKKIYELYLSK